ncbi:hypothetical protein [Antarcticirhabdus aurantiaca]|uniref:Uncharacterized protein n=1 Tax=Antarcticirhabdus aurantiaca TaxID=2606717 RepID=A0ACD4NWD4_9HYPH|nr:hypothetical protein [Antarcticirhabdus aurantiaca]WAJ31142.1 hypothetical protein OXU80_13460 [Jeongeuplla avenae]
MADIKDDGLGVSAEQQRGAPLKHHEIVSEDDAGSASIEEELRQEAATDKPAKADEATSQFEGLDNDLVNVGKFTDEAQD